MDEIRFAGYVVEYVPSRQRKARTEEGTIKGPWEPAELTIKALGDIPRPDWLMGKRVEVIITPKEARNGHPTGNVSGRLVSSNSGRVLVGLPEEEA